MATLGTVQKYRNLVCILDADLAATSDITPWMRANGPTLRVITAGNWVGTLNVYARPAGGSPATQVAFATYTDGTAPAVGTAKGFSLDIPTDLEYAVEFTARTSGTLSVRMYSNLTDAHNR